MIWVTDLGHPISYCVVGGNAQRFPSRRNVKPSGRKGEKPRVLILNRDRAPVAEEEE